MALDPAQLPDDVASLKAMLIAASSRADDLDAEIENLKLTITKLQHDKFGNSSERTSVLMDQLGLQLGELVERRAQEKAAEDIAAAQAPASSTAGNTVRVCHSTGRARSSRAKASNSTCRPWQTGSARRRRR